MISLRDFSFRYPNSLRHALEHISFDMNNGESLGVIGPSQAGKTTLAYALTGILQKHFERGISSGVALFEERDAVRDRSAVGFVFQDAMLQLSGATETVEEEIAFSLEQFGLPQSVIRERIEEQLELLRLRPLRRRHPKTLSGGETQMVVIACEAAKHPKLFILDEPTRYLDAGRINDLVQVMHSLTRSSTLILIEERADIPLALCDRILFLEGGLQHFFGSPSGFLQSNRNISSVDLPDWIEIQQLLGRQNISLSYRNAIQWLKSLHTSI